MTQYGGEDYTVEHWQDDTGWGVVEVTVDPEGITVSGTCGTENTPPEEPANDNGGNPPGAA